MPRDGRGAAGAAGAAAWLRRWWRALLGEAVATALLVLLGVATTLGRPLQLTHPALGFGFIVLINAEAFGAVSGAHMNPAVTLAALLYGKIGAAPAAGYVVAQTLGAVAGFGALARLVPAAARGAAGCTLTAAPLQGACVEALLTGALALLACGLWAAHDDARPDRTAGLKIALGVSGLIYAGGPQTGASLNPARSFAPALIHNEWTNHWVYWVGPLGGAALATLLHRYVLCPRARPAGPARPPGPAHPAPADEQLPLQDKV